jgi:hypothetical protein
MRKGCLKYFWAIKFLPGLGKGDPAALEIREMPRPQEDAGGFRIHTDCTHGMIQ